MNIATLIKTLKEARGGETIFDEETGKRIGTLYEVAADRIAKMQYALVAIAEDKSCECYTEIAKKALEFESTTVTRGRMK